MKNWIYKQLTEVTAWAGFACVVCAFLAPRWVLFVIGLVLIYTDDEKAKAWVNEKAPWLSAKFKEWLEV